MRAAFCFGVLIMNKIEQTFFGTSEQFIDYSHNITEEDGDITLAPGVPYHVGEGVYNLVIVRWQRRTLTPEEVETVSIPEHAKSVGTYSQVDLGGITVKPIGKTAVWQCRTNNSDCVRYALTLADRIKQAQLGSDSTVTRYTEEGRIIMENASHQQNRLSMEQADLVTNNYYGDYVAGDKIGGDKVGGDKITVGNISDSINTSSSANKETGSQEKADDTAVPTSEDCVD